MTHKQDIRVLKSQLESEKALKERHQQHRATPCEWDAPLAMKPQRGVIRLISFDSSRRALPALPCAIDNAHAGLGICAIFIPQGVALNN
ncbi:MAG: hypothetical protein LBL04_12420 [Bacteroidales bacterium]|jgi:hypothetical protein|nr:hypothetical protein [Bacteroidales bacterium]